MLALPEGPFNLVHRSEEVRAELARVLSSVEFASALRARGLLTYLVEALFSARGPRLKEYTIATELFGRGTDYDPRLDACVRTEVWRLRHRLERYYSTEGRGNPLRIELPRRSFLPTVRAAAQAEPARVAVVPAVAERPWMTAAPMRLRLEGLTTRGIALQGSDLGAAVTDELAVELARLGCVEVVRHPDQAPWVLYGSVQASGGHLRTLVQLYDHRQGAQVWAQALRHRLDDPLLLQQAIARDLADALLASPIGATFAGEALGSAASSFFDLLRQTLSNDFACDVDPLRTLQRRIGPMIRWTQQYPDDLAAQHQLTLLLSRLIQTVPEEGLMHLAVLRATALRLARLDPTAVEPLLALGMACLTQYNWHGALQVFERAVERAPEHPGAHMARGLCRLHLAQLDAAHRDLVRAFELAPDAVAPVATLGYLRLHMGDCQGAVALARKAVAIDASFEPAHVLLGDAECRAGNVERGIACLEAAGRQVRSSPLALGRLGYTYALHGRPRQARELLDELEASAHRLSCPAAAIADIHLALGEKDAALRWLGDAVRRRAVRDLAWLRSTSHYDSLRGDARFDALLCDMQLSPERGALAH